jgi:ABC-2 type transport system ATP-binding protein
MEPAFAIRTAGLSRHFDAKGSGVVHAVRDLTLEVPAGIIYGFLGPNGAGKTTTIRLLLGLVEPTAGTAQVLGYDSRNQADAIRANTGALLEHPGIYERLTAEENLEFYARAWRMPAAARRERIRELLIGFGLWERRHQDAGQWSRGMKQKLAVARALLHRPRLIFLDEPTAGFDPLAAAALGSDLVNLAAREGTTVFLTTHNLSEAEKLCSQIGVIRRGTLVATGSPAEIRAAAGGQFLEVTGTGFSPHVVARLQAQPQVRGIDHHNGRLRIALDDATTVAPLVRLLVEAGADVEEVRKGAASLEEAFLGLMEDEAGGRPADA